MIIQITLEEAQAFIEGRILSELSMSQFRASGRVQILARSLEPNQPTINLERLISIVRSFSNSTQTGHSPKFPAIKAVREEAIRQNQCIGLADAKRFVELVLNIP